MKYTILNDQSYQEKIQKSLFFGQLKHVKDQESAKLFFQEINKQHPQATHNCPAYIVGKKGEICFCSDDQEPSGTAGRPILNMLQKHELTNIALVVTRYYGGVQLGVRGLIDAYGKVAEQTILSNEKVPVIEYFSYICSMPYDFYNIFLHRVKIEDVNVLTTDYSDKIESTLSVSEHKENELLAILNELVNNQKFTFSKTQGC